MSIHFPKFVLVLLVFVDCPSDFAQSPVLSFLERGNISDCSAFSFCCSSFHRSLGSCSPLLWIVWRLARYLLTWGSKMQYRGFERVLCNHPASSADSSKQKYRSSNNSNGILLKKQGEKPPILLCSKLSITHLLLFVKLFWSRTNFTVSSCCPLAALSHWSSFRHHWLRIAPPSPHLSTASKHQKGS